MKLFIDVCRGGFYSAAILLAWVNVIGIKAPALSVWLLICAGCLATNRLIVGSPKETR
jgi:hypothetical protein